MSSAISLPTATAELGDTASRQEKLAESTTLPTEASFPAPLASDGVNEGRNPRAPKAPTLLSYVVGGFWFIILFGIPFAVFHVSVAAVILIVGYVLAAGLLLAAYAVLPATASAVIPSLSVSAEDKAAFLIAYLQTGLLGAAVSGVAIGLYVSLMLLGIMHFEARNVQGTQHVSQEARSNQSNAAAGRKWTETRWGKMIKRGLKTVILVSESIMVITGALVTRWWTGGEENVVIANLWFVIASNLLGVSAQQCYRRIRGKKVASVLPQKGDTEGKVASSQTEQSMV